VVLPALTGKSYEKLEIADGKVASIRFCEMAFGKIDESETNRIRTALETYCDQDAEGLLAIVNELRRFCE
jgi:hypothetical protein